MPRLRHAVWLLMLAGCASVPAQRLTLPEPRLAPAAMAVDLALSQRLCIRRTATEQPCEPIEARLEVDAQALHLAGFALGQRVLVVHWDGARLQTQRTPQLPPSADAERILRDIQYVYAPLAALQAALPEHWRVVDRGNERELRHGRTSAIRIRYATMPPWGGAVRLDNRVEGYRLDIDTVADAREPG